MKPQPTATARAVCVLALGALLLAGCDSLFAARLGVTPGSAYVDLDAGERSATFTVRNDGGRASVLEWRFTSDDLIATPNRGTLTNGGSQSVVVTFAAVNPGLGPASGRFVADEGFIPVDLVAYSGLLCDPAVAFGSLAATEGTWLVGYRDALAISSSSRATASVAIERAAVAVGGAIVRRGAGSEHDLVRIPPSASIALVASLARRPEVAYVAPNAPIARSAAPDDPLFDQQWNLSGFGAEAAWAIVDALAPEPTTVVVAIVDDGFASGHPGLSGALLPGWDVFDDDADVRNCTDHGTHVAGIVSARRGDGVGVTGVASVPWVRVVPVKAWPNSGDASTSTTLDAVIRAMRWAGGLSVAGLPVNPHPADVINLSLGANDSPSLRTAFAKEIAELQAVGILVVAAAGNSSSNPLQVPAGAGALAVGSVDFDYRRSSFSNFGDGLTLMAPGGKAPAGNYCGTTKPLSGVLSTGVDYDLGSATYDWTCKQGTSMATPFVSGAAALLLGLEPSLRGDPDGIALRLAEAAALQRPTDYTASLYGAGVLCLDALLTDGSVCGVPSTR